MCGVPIEFGIRPRTVCRVRIKKDDWLQCVDYLESIQISIENRVKIAVQIAPIRLRTRSAALLRG